jgi:hypothetical protein
MNTEQFYPLFLQAANVVIDSRKIEKMIFSLPFQEKISMQPY